MTHADVDHVLETIDNVLGWTPDPDLSSDAMRWAPDEPDPTPAKPAFDGRPVDSRGILDILMAEGIYAGRGPRYRFLTSSEQLALAGRAHGLHIDFDRMILAGYVYVIPIPATPDVGHPAGNQGHEPTGVLIDETRGWIPVGGDHGYRGLLSP